MIIPKLEQRKIQAKMNFLKIIKNDILTYKNNKNDVKIVSDFDSFLFHVKQSRVTHFEEFSLVIWGEGGGEIDSKQKVTHSLLLCSLFSKRYMGVDLARQIVFRVDT